MLKINIHQVLSDAEAARIAPKPLPKVFIKRLANHDDDLPLDDKSPIVINAWNDFNVALLERKKLSSEIWKMVQSGATKEELKEHYEMIESYRPLLQELFDQARHVEKHGVLPPKKSEANASDVLSLKYEKKKISEKRSKLKAKILKGQATNAPRLPEWQLELDQAEAEYFVLEERIRKMEGK